MTAFGKIPAAVVDAGCLRKLRQAEALTYLILCRHCDGEDWTSWPSVGLIASESGLSRRSVQKGLRGLEHRQLIKSQQRGGGRSRTAVYVINSAPACALSERETAHLGARNSADRRPKGRTRVRPNRVNRENRGAASPRAALRGGGFGRVLERQRANDAAIEPASPAEAAAMAAEYLRARGLDGGEP